MAWSLLGYSQPLLSFQRPHVGHLQTLPLQCCGQAREKGSSSPFPGLSPPPRAWGHLGGMAGGQPPTHWIPHICSSLKGLAPGGVRPS